MEETQKCIGTTEFIHYEEEEETNAFTMGTDNLMFKIKFKQVKPNLSNALLSFKEVTSQQSKRDKKSGSILLCLHT
eukprot:scaffold150263_cov76-Attheya_sp.AAC.3